MTSSLVGSEMCIRDRKKICPFHSRPGGCCHGDKCKLEHSSQSEKQQKACLLYTSDAADDM
eukprot:7331373-Prorocentrum_lima.AAC.1